MGEASDGNNTMDVLGEVYSTKSEKGLDQEAYNMNWSERRWRHACHARNHRRHAHCGMIRLFCFGANNTGMVIKMPFPKQEERKKCWASKDAYWQCLTDNNDDKGKCQRERQEYENSCIKQWVIYFDRRRDYLKYKEKIETSGPDPLPEYTNKNG